MNLNEYLVALSASTTTVEALSADPAALIAVPAVDPATAYAALLAAGALFLRSLGATEEGGADEQRQIGTMLVNGGFTPPANMSDGPARALGQLLLNDLVEREQGLTEVANAYAEAAANAEARGDTSDAAYCREREAHFRALI
ncbi:MAG: hypothetical protein FJ361_09790 [Gemmatimonadetes bacterium]|nr:hypothetical protein [Gemmatimonadota bacterium]